MLDWLMTETTKEKEMIEREFAIGTYEIELLNDVDRETSFSVLDDVCLYIDTAINYNNDYLLATTNKKIISKISACHYDAYEFMITNHLRCLHRSFIDVMLVHSNRGDWKRLIDKMKDDVRFKHLGVSNFTTNDMLEYKRIVGKLPEYCELEINPQYADIETIEFCKKNNIKIIAYAILGGKYRAMKNIATYSLPYLMSFAAKFADILILRADSITQAKSFFDVVKNYTIDDNITFDNIEQHKAIEPMKYDVPNVVKRFCNELTYYNSCGKNKDDVFKNKKRINIEFPKFEMLGDYKTYIRYLFGGTKYEYDFLIGDNKNLYVVYLFDEKNRLTKVNNNDVDIQVYEFEAKL